MSSVAYFSTVYQDKGGTIKWSPDMRIDDAGKEGEILRTVKVVREERGISQRALARALGMDVGSYNKIENGKIGLKVSTVFRIAEALEVEAAELLGRRSEGFNRLWSLFSELSPERQDRILDQMADLAELERSRREGSDE